MKRILLSVLFAVFAVIAMAQAKYVFYFIGDGMGPNQVLTAEMYQASLQGKIGRVPLLMTQFPYSGQALRTLNYKAGIGWINGGHTATAVPIFAIGVGAEYFTGWHDNSEIAPLIYQATRE